MSAPSLRSLSRPTRQAYSQRLTRATTPKIETRRALCIIACFAYTYNIFHTTAADFWMLGVCSDISAAVPTTYAFGMGRRGDLNPTLHIFAIMLQLYLNGIVGGGIANMHFSFRSDK